MDPRLAASFFSFVVLAIAAAPLRAEQAKASDHLIVHEWGTFTALQDELGRTIRGINTDDEPLPDFVHNDNGMLLQNPSDLPPVQFKGISRVHPDVIVRLETPVIYFYPPKDKPDLRADVQVQFKGGWLTQYYPDAEAKNPNLRNAGDDVGSIRPGTVSSLRWSNLKIGGTTNGPRTDSRVWLAPREVQAASVQTPANESERYLFYRGVAKINPPLRVSRLKDDADRLELSVQGKKDLSAAWLVDVRQDGAIAVRSLGQVAAGDATTRVSAKFTDADYATDNLKVVRKALKAALVHDGLFDDEADAMMNTWEVSYFRRPGMRVFFMVPRAWTDEVLPLRVTPEGSTAAPEMQRAMIGRIELVTPFQRERLKRISQTAPADGTWLGKALQDAQANKSDQYREEWFRQVFSGQRSLLNENIQMPDEFRDYLQLGRFRNALILDELTQRPTGYLQNFVQQYALQYSQVERETERTAARK